jgi:hypothetical protein
MPEIPKGPLIPSRVLIMGEHSIPREELERLSDEHIKTFLREPDPNKWPSEMAHLTKYLSKEEQIRWGIQGVLAEHNELLGNSLKHWSLAVWKDLVQKHHFQQETHEQIIEGMAYYLKELVQQYLTLEGTGNKG